MYTVQAQQCVDCQCCIYLFALAPVLLLRVAVRELPGACASLCMPQKSFHSIDQSVLSWLHHSLCMFERVQTGAVSRLLSACCRCLQPLPGWRLGMGWNGGRDSCHVGCSARKVGQSKQGTYRSCELSRVCGKPCVERIWGQNHCCP